MRRALRIRRFFDFVPSYLKQTFCTQKKSKTNLQATNKRTKHRLTNFATFQVLSWELSVLLAFSLHLSHSLRCHGHGPVSCGLLNNRPLPFAGAADSDGFTFRVVFLHFGIAGEGLILSKRWFCAGCWMVKWKIPLVSTLNLLRKIR